MESNVSWVGWNCNPNTLLVFQDITVFVTEIGREEKTSMGGLWKLSKWRWYWNLKGNGLCGLCYILVEKVIVVYKVPTKIASLVTWAKRIWARNVKQTRYLHSLHTTSCVLLSLRNQWKPNLMPWKRVTRVFGTAWPPITHFSSPKPTFFLKKFQVLEKKIKPHSFAFWYSSFRD